MGFRHGARTSQIDGAGGPPHLADVKRAFGTTGARGRQRLAVALGCAAGVAVDSVARRCVGTRLDHVRVMGSPAKIVLKNEKPGTVTRALR